MWNSGEGVGHVHDPVGRALQRIRRGDDIVQVIAHFGYKDRPDVPATLRLASTSGLAMDVSNPSYHVSTTPSPWQMPAACAAGASTCASCSRGSPRIPSPTSGSRTNAS